MDRVAVALLAALVSSALAGGKLAERLDADWPRFLYLAALGAHGVLALLRFRRRTPQLSAQRSSLTVAWLLLLAAAGAFVLLPLVANPARAFPANMLGSRWWVNIGCILVGFLIEIVVRLHRTGNLPGTAACFLALGAFPLYLLYTGNGALISSGDNLANRNLPHLVLQEHTIALDGLRELQGSKPHYSGIRIGERILPIFPLGTGLLAVPYGAAALCASRGAVNESLLSRWEKHFAALIATLSACLLFFGMRRGYGAEGAAFSALLFGVATPMFTTASQGMWSFTGEMFFVALALCTLLPPAFGGWRLALAGFAMGAAFLCRPTALVLAIAIIAAVITLDRRRGLSLAVVFACVSAAVAAALYVIYGHPLGAYGMVNSSGWVSGFWSGFAATLLSPGRGLLVYFPYIALLPALLRYSAGKGFAPWVVASLTGFAAMLILVSSYGNWAGGWSVGPRLLTELSPLLALLALPLWLNRKRLGWLRVPAAGLLAWSALTQLLGAYNPAAYRWNGIVAVQDHPEMVWSWRDGQLAATWIPGWTRHIDPYGRPRAATDTASRWIRIDLAPVANARYDANPFSPAEPRADAAVYYPRIDPGLLNDPSARFHFASRGAPNAIAGGRGVEPPAIRVPSIACTRLHALLAVDQTRRAEGTPDIAAWEVVFEDGSRETIPIRLNRDVFEYRPDHRGTQAPADRLYLGSALDPDTLIRSEFLFQHAPGRIASITLQAPRRGSNVAIVLLALTLEQ